jgi:hypothetical protein
MGFAKQLWMEQQEEEYLEERAAWIRERLGDPEADESTDGWSRLEDEYELFHSGSGRDYDYEDDWEVEGKSTLDIFKENIEASREILSLPISNGSKKNLLVMLHAHIVTAVEAYLSATFIEKALETEELMRKLVETDPEFAKRKFTIQEIFTRKECLKDDVRQYLKDLIFHDIAKVKEMYKAVFDIDFGDVGWLFKAVALRHDCVHRAGYDKNGNEAPLTTESVSSLADQSSTLIATVEEAIAHLPKQSDLLWKF